MLHRPRRQERQRRRLGHGRPQRGRPGRHRRQPPQDPGPRLRRALKVDLGKGAFYDSDGKTAGFLWIEATTQEFADSFINDNGVLITSDSCPSRVERRRFDRRRHRLDAAPAHGREGRVRARRRADRGRAHREIRLSRLRPDLLDRRQERGLDAGRPQGPPLVRPARPRRRGRRHPQLFHHPRHPPRRSGQLHGQPRHRRIRGEERLVRRGQGRRVRFQEGLRQALEPRARRGRQRAPSLEGPEPRHRQDVGARPRLSVLREARTEE